MFKEEIISKIDIEAKAQTERIFKEHSIYSQLYEAWRDEKCKDFIWNEAKTGKTLFGFTEKDDNGIFDLFIMEDIGDICLDTPFSLEVQKRWRFSFSADSKEDDEYIDDITRTEQGMLWDYISKPIF